MRGNGSQGKKKTGTQEKKTSVRKVARPNRGDTISITRLTETWGTLKEGGKKKEPSQWACSGAQVAFLVPKKSKKFKQGAMKWDTEAIGGGGSCIF